MHTTLGSALDERGNALNLIRLVLASAVVVGHATPLGGFSPNVLTEISSIAVNGFFVLSGFLIAGSRMRNGARSVSLAPDSAHHAGVLGEPGRGRGGHRTYGDQRLR